MNDRQEQWYLDKLNQKKYEELKAKLESGEIDPERITGKAAEALKDWARNRERFEEGSLDYLKEKYDSAMSDVPSLHCPKENGGCDSYDKWIVAIDVRIKRLILDCANCGYRYSFPLDDRRFITSYTGPISEGEPTVKL